MSVFRLTNKFLFSNINIAQNAAILNQNRYLSVSCKRYCAEPPADNKPVAVSSEKDRTKIIPVDISIKYLNSEAYKTTYGDKLVWEQYRRNHLGLFAPRKTRRTCIRKGVISTGLCFLVKNIVLVECKRNLISFLVYLLRKPVSHLS